MTKHESHVNLYIEITVAKYLMIRDVLYSQTADDYVTLQHNLSCMYKKSTVVPFVRFKVEQLHFFPTVILVHDFITEIENKFLIHEASPNVCIFVYSLCNRRSK